MDELRIECGGETFIIGPPEDEDWSWIIGGLESTYVKDAPPGADVEIGLVREKVVLEVERLRSNLAFQNDLFVARNEAGKRAAYLWIIALPLQYTGEMRGWMFQLYVSDDFRGLGLGKALMRLGEDWTLALGMDRIAVTVGANNAEGRGILDAMGFEIEGYNMGKSLASKGRKDDQ